VVGHYSGVEGLRRAEEMRAGLVGLGKISGKIFIPRGIYRFRTHEEANAHWLKYQAAAIAAEEAKREKKA
jgi:hypothetical protein